ELARRYHPDINPDPSAVEKIKSINEAYRVLGDPDRRATYDAQLLLERHRANAAPAAAAAHPATPSNPPRAARPGTPHAPPAWQGRAGFNGFGRIAPDEPPFHSVPRAEPPRRSARKPAEPVEQVVERLTSEAQLAYINRHYLKAE